MAELMLYWIWLIQIYEGIFEWKQIIYTWNFFDFLWVGFLWIEKTHLYPDYVLLIEKVWDIFALFL